MLLLQKVQSDEEQFLTRQERSDRDIEALTAQLDSLHAKQTVERKEMQSKLDQ
jgi:cell division protein FtsB